MLKRWFLFVLVIACWLSVTGCPKQPILAPSKTGIFMQELNSKTKAVYPADWPLTALELPSDATEEIGDPTMQGSYNAHYIHKPNHGINEAKGAYWGIGFDTDLKWNELFEHTDKCMKEADFQLWDERPLEVWEHVGVRTEYASRDYLSKDRMMEVHVTYKDSSGSWASPAYKGCTYEVWLFEVPYTWPNQDVQPKPIP